MYLCTVHMTRMLLLVQAFMRIYRVSSLLKTDQTKVDEETHRTALQLQLNIQQHILPQSEAKLKESAKRIAQYLHAKVRGCVRVCGGVGVCVVCGTCDSDIAMNALRMCIVLWCCESVCAVSASLPFAGSGY